MNKWSKYTASVLAGIFFLVGGGLLVHSQVQKIAGIAVAASATAWNRVIDASQGDNQTKGIMAIGLYGFDAAGGNFDRIRGTAADGIDTRVTNAGGGAAVNIQDGGNVVSVDDAGGSLTVDDGGGSITVDGTLSVSNSGAAFFAVKRVDIAAVSVNLPFGFTSEKVAIIADLGNTDEVCLDWLGGTAVCPAANTAGDDRLSPGEAIVLDDYGVTSLSVIAESGTQTVFVKAWN